MIPRIRFGEGSDELMLEEPAGGSAGAPEFSWPYAMLPHNKASNNAQVILALGLIEAPFRGFLFLLSSSQ